MTNLDNPTNNITPIFGFGYMRSGTTLLFNILKNHPDIYTSAQEPKIIDSMLIIKKTYNILILMSRVSAPTAKSIKLFNPNLKRSF